MALWECRLRCGAQFYCSGDRDAHENPCLDAHREKRRLVERMARAEPAITRELERRRGEVESTCNGPDCAPGCSGTFGGCVP